MLGAQVRHKKGYQDQAVEGDQHNGDLAELGKLDGFAALIQVGIRSSHLHDLFLNFPMAKARGF